MGKHPLSHTALVRTVFVSMACMLFFISCATVQAKKITEVKVGYILPLTGPASQAGIQNQKACELATGYINAAGGIKSLGGVKLVNVWENSRGEPAFGVTAAEKLIKTDKVSIISGAWNSAVTYPTTQTAEQSGIPYIVPVSVRDTITERDFKYTFRIAAKDSWRNRDQFRFLEEMSKASKTKIGTCAFVYESGGWGTAMKDQWTKLVGQFGYKVVLAEPYASTSADLIETVVKIKNAQPDVIMLASMTSDAVLLAKSMAVLNVKAKAIIATGAGHASQAFMKGAGRNCEYIFDVSEWEPDINRPGIEELRVDYKKKYGSDFTAETVDAFASVYVIADALERAGSDNPQKIRSALSDTNLCRGKGKKGIDILPYDCVEFDRSGQNKNARFVMVQFRKIKGTMERVTVWPSDIARKGFKPVFPMP
ncbi:MAG TPA: ABC transporter substrate-binding protein [Desulfomonilia bacterium]|nr:ABC transporter substrate-binding protein [Desulfomonilia bacterium]